MQENCLNNSYNQNYCPYPQTNANPNAVSINIITPQAFASNPCTTPDDGFYSMYGTNSQPNLPLYPQNYNNMINQTPMQTPANTDNSRNLAGDTNLLPKTGDGKPEPVKEPEKNENTKKDKKTKTITPLTDDYIKSLENYLNNDNAKVRLIAAKDIMERFKEDESRKDNASLIPLLNKALRDPSPSVRFLALTTLQLGYSVGDDETISILKEIQSQNGDHLSEDALLASEILLKLSAPEKVKVNKGEETEESQTSKKDEKEEENDDTI